MEKRIIRLIIRLLRRTDLSIGGRSLLTTALLDKLGALPFQDVIGTSDMGIVESVNGRPIDVEFALRLQEGARAAVNNLALKTVREQVAMEAIKIGVHKAESDKQMYFSRAAIWYHQQLESKLNALAAVEK